MTATTINTKTAAPTAEAIQEALAFLRNLSEKNSGESGEKAESFFNSDIFKTIEAALKSSAEAKTVSENGEDASDENDDAEDAASGKETSAQFSRSDSEDSEDDEDEEDEDDDEGDDEEENSDDGWDIGDVLAIGAGVALGAAVVYGGIKRGKAIFSDGEEPLRRQTKRRKSRRP